MPSLQHLAARVLRAPGPFGYPAVRRVVRVSFIGLSASIATVVVVLVTDGDSAYTPLVVVAGVAGAIAGSLVARVMRPVGERYLRVTTNARLLELANPAHPLMRKLMTIAPGTYMHSVITANLAAAGAEAVGANALVARVGAYYHDVGKILRPEFFFENLFGEENPHEGSTPDRSTSIIIAHVRDGLELAEAHGLPREISDIIGEHHGTSVVKCFYGKAAEADASVFESAFRYPASLPHTREAALVMLADGCEAAVRALRTPSDEETSDAVGRVVADRLADGQLAESGLTEAQVDAVADVFTRILVSMYHPRMEYPDTPLRSDHADIRHEPSRARTA